MVCGWYVGGVWAGGVGGWRLTGGKQVSLNQLSVWPPTDAILPADQDLLFEAEACNFYKKESSDAPATAS